MFNCRKPFQIPFNCPFNVAKIENPTQKLSFEPSSQPSAKKIYKKNRESQRIKPTVSTAVIYKKIPFFEILSPM